MRRVHEEGQFECWQQLGTEGLLQHTPWWVEPDTQGLACAQQGVVADPWPCAQVEYCFTGEGSDAAPAPASLRGLDAAVYYRGGALLNCGHAAVGTKSQYTCLVRALV